MVLFNRGIVAMAIGSVVSAHMGISSPVPVDRMKGDAYRYPVNGGQNGGACHGHGDGAVYTWVWTPKSSGACEIYQNCFKTLDASGELKMSGGAAHDGGPCKLYKCTGAIGIPVCKRNELPDSFSTCVEIASVPDCTMKGKMEFTGAAGGTQAPPPEGPEIVPVDLGGDDATLTKIRCGTTWQAANDECGTKCRKDEDCTISDEKCYADLQDCPDGGTIPVDRPVRTDEGATTCRSKKAHIRDTWCESVGCSADTADYCHIGASGSDNQLPKCIPYLTFEGQSWSDVALKYDVDMMDLKAFNERINVGVTLPNADTIIEIVGDCETARATPVPSHATSLSISSFAALTLALAAF